MQGTLRKQTHGYQWMRVGHAQRRFSNIVRLVSLAVVICLAVWLYTEIPKTALRPVYFIGMCLAAAAAYLNLGVWIHEQLHCLPFHGTEYEKRVRIMYERKFVLALHGHYRVFGSMDYQILRCALSGPLGLVIGWLILGWLGNFILPGWWLPLLGTLAVISAWDMVHDLYWLLQIREIGAKGKYWDNGHELHVVWKE